MEHFKIVIVGGGSVGLSMAVFLGHHGVQCLVVEKHKSRSIHPRATGFGVRSQEIFRSIGLLEPLQKVREALSVASGRITVHTLAGTNLADIPRARTPGDSMAQLLATLSPATMGPLPQDKLDEVLCEECQRLGIEIRYSTQCTELSDDGNGVTLSLQQLKDGSTAKVRAAFVVAADGAGGRIRSMLDIGAHGPGLLGQPMINALFKADLSDLVKGHEFVMCVVENPESPGMLVSINSKDVWVFHMAVDVEKGQRVDDFTSEEVIRRIRLAIGIPTLSVELLSVLSWQPAARVADTFSKGRVFLVGDAAHVVPPTGAFGLNTGIIDAHNLAWKLAMVLQGVATEKLLDTYAQERRPVADFTMDQALKRFARPELHWNPTLIEERKKCGVATPAVVHLGYRYTVENGEVHAIPPSFEDVLLDGSVGSRIPHVWLSDGVSTLDVVFKNFVLFVDEKATGWSEVAAQVSSETKTPLQVQKVSDPAFAERVGIQAQGALLVRPDGFVAWRTNQPASFTALALIFAEAPAP